METREYTGGGRDWQSERRESPDERFERHLRELQAEQDARDEEIDDTLAEIADVMSCLANGTLDYDAAAGTLIAHEGIIVEALRMYRS